MKALQAKAAKRIAAATRFPFLRLEFEPATQREFEKLQVRTHCPAGATLFEQGTEPMGMYVVHSGAVRLSIARNGAALLVRVAGPGEAIGVIATVANRPYVVTAVATQRCEVSFVAKEAFWDFMNRYPAARLEVLKFLTHEVSGAYQHVRALGRQRTLARGRAARP